MSAATTLDQVVKGAPSLSSNPDVVKKEPGVPSTGDAPRASPQPPADPTSLLPSSPPQIYLNLLILEASLRQQYLTLRARKRQHTLVVAGLIAWIVGCFYLQFLRPREDGSGIGGSVYWLVDTAEKVALIGGCVMAVLFWATGQWERGMRWPRKWLGTTNRGLRTMNCKIVILKGPWWSEMLSHLSFLLPMQPSTPGSSYHYIDYPASHERRPSALHTGTGGSRRSQEWAEEDVAHGGDHVKILLLPKQFTPDFRENWEMYRAEYWEQENQRRRDLRRRIRARDRDLAKQQGGWLWWTGWRGWAHAWNGVLGAPTRPPHRDVTPPALQQHHVHSGLAHHPSLKDKHRRRPSAVKDRDGSHSRSSSRSSVVTNSDAAEMRERRWSTASTGSSTGERRRRSKLIDGAMVIDSSSASVATGTSARTGGRPARLTPVGSPRPGSSGSRPGTPILDKRASTLSTSSTISDISTAEGKARVVLENSSDPVTVKTEQAD